MGAWGALRTGRIRWSSWGRGGLVLGMVGHAFLLSAWGSLVNANG